MSPGSWLVALEPEIATPARAAKIKAYGAEAVIGGAPYAEAQEACDAYPAEKGALTGPSLTSGSAFSFAALTPISPHSVGARPAG